MEENRVLISADTGEVLTNLEKGDRIVRSKSIERYKKNAESEFAKRSFIRVDIREGALILKELNPYEKSLLFTIQYYVAYESGIIQYPNGKEIGFDDICSLTGLSREKTATVLSSLIKKDLIYKGKNSRKVQYFMNPWIATKGIAPNPTLKEMFKNYKIRSKASVMWKDLDD